jgi:hypothetical protein
VPGSTPDFSTLVVAPIDKPTAKALVVEHHYSHTWNNGLFGAANYGIFRDGRLLGAAVYGYAMNPKSWAAVSSTPPEQCLELNRLWIDDELGANTETWLLGQTFRLLRADGIELIQSFADGRLGVGTIYQASNFTYHGYHSTQFHRDSETGVTYHGAPFSNTAKARPMLDRNYGFVRGVHETLQVRTYRYLYPLNRRARKSILLPAQPYPKERAGEIPVPGYRPPVSQIARCVAIAERLADPRLPEFEAYLATLTDAPEALVEKQRSNPFVLRLAA